ncbi:MAG: adenylyl-sulfate kinase [Bacteroidales bacterium]|nr:adenylyl-sulfate kinase [Bacteroidales bacterium]
MGDAQSESKHLTWHKGKVCIEDRDALVGQRGCVVWLTGLSGSGKSTIACALEERLVREGRLAFILDGDNVRQGLNRDLAFSPEDRAENIRRIGEVGALFSQAGIITIAAFISPYAVGRDAGREAAGPGRFFEVFLDTPLQECEKRDPKGLYVKARAGELSDFTGVNAPYERPVSPELVMNTAELSVEECVNMIVLMLQEQGVFDVTT